MDLLSGIKILAYLTVISQLIVLFLIYLLITKKSSSSNKILSFFRKNALLFAFIVALTATSGSIFFSEILKLVPCKLCWFQRIFMYPQVIILGISLIRKEKSIKYVIIPLCIIGALFSIYHYSTQVNYNLTQTSSGTCSATEPCESTPFLQLGYITIPLMALTAFTFITFLLLI
ncbi:MAG: disulfide bond formation protein B [archaeon]